MTSQQKLSIQGESFMKFKLHSLSIFLSAIWLCTTSLMAQDKKLIIASPWEITSYDPAVSGFAIQKLQIMENLVDADENGNLRPGLATSWKMSQDGLSWSFVLRENVEFHDKTSLDAQAVVQVLERAWKQPGVLKKAPITSISAEKNAIVFSLKKPFAALPALLAHATTIIISPSSFDEQGLPKALIGTGPFKVETFTPPQRIDLKRFAGYWGKPAILQEVGYVAVGRAETRALMAETGDAHMVFTLDPSGFARLQDIAHIKTQALPIPRVLVLKVNAGHRFFDSPQARQALSLAINREAIAKAITRFPDSAAKQLFPPALGKWHNPSLEPLAFNLEQAARLLANLGWKKGADGILTRNGERFSILLRTFPDRPELPLIAAVLQDQWKELGIELEVSVANYSEIPAGHQDGSLHLGLYARNYSLTPDPIGTVLQDFSLGGGDWGAMGWDNKEVASSLETIASSGDSELRSSHIAQVAEILQQQLPVIPIGWYQHTVTLDAKLKGVVIDPLQRSYGIDKIYWSN